MTSTDEFHKRIFDTVELAFAVRVAQKRYFKTREQNHLILAKTAEKKLDEALKALGYELEN